ncbi:hypothetical protein SCHPADRAFT_928635 [Schizopora paradoxa]|uniref:Uncharacterized protein n=1 Tax=Schizopora paradoxa TaxID=27342 RepID=A0A0H2RN25_9AGAM|nr:hypothetical protein SCHPADRAFT_928635 [Schizopora paradoxa]
MSQSSDHDNVRKVASQNANTDEYDVLGKKIAEDPNQGNDPKPDSSGMMHVQDESLQIDTCTSDAQSPEHDANVPPADATDDDEDTNSNEGEGDGETGDENDSKVQDVSGVGVSRFTAKGRPNPGTSSGTKKPSQPKPVKR